MNWIKQIKNENYIASKEWLERKASDEFSKKQDVEHSWGMKIENQIDEDIQKIADQVIEEDDNEDENNKNKESQD